MTQYENSTAAKVSDGLGRFSQAVAAGLEVASRKLGETIEAVSPRNVQVFQISPSSGRTSDYNFQPSFIIKGNNLDGSIQVTGRFPVHANNGAGEIKMERDFSFDLDLYDAQDLLAALEHGAHIQDCFTFDGWTIDGEKIDETYARGRDLDNLTPNFVYNGNEGRMRETGLHAMFNISVADTFDTDAFKEALAMRAAMLQAQERARYAPTRTPFPEFHLEPS